LYAVCRACAWVVEFLRAVHRPENQKRKTKIWSGSQQIEPTRERQRKVTHLDLLLLRLEGCARGLSFFLQVNDHRILFLVGLMQVLVGDA
jgi:hypothetical protein